MKTIILAGGLGSRLAEETVVRPKPMVEIGGKPIIWHILQWYSKHGFNEFIVALGYKGDVIKEYFLNHYSHNADLSVDLRTGRVTTHESQGPSWLLHLVDTGQSTQTGGRLKRLRSWVSESTFMATYGDGLADVDLKQVVAFHKAHGKLATVTAVRPPSRFGALQFDGDRVVSFLEKPQTSEGWINGGFFVLEPGALDYVDSDDMPFEREPLERLARDGQLQAYQHSGFFQPMDTVRDRQLLESLWQSGAAPWRVE